MLVDTTIFFTSWVVDFLQFEIPDTLLFIHHLAGETIPFTLVNNTDDTLNNGTLNGEFEGGIGQIVFIGQPFPIYPFEAKELHAFIVFNNEVGRVKLRAEVEDHGNIEVVRRIARTMSFNHSNNIFQDDFSSRSINWNIIYRGWDASDSVSKDTTGGSHLAMVEASSLDWTDYKF